MPWVYVIQRFQRRDRDEGRRDGGRDSGAGADRERQRRERLQQQKRGQWNAYWQDKNAPRVVYNSSVICCALLLSSVIFSAFLCKLWMSRIAKPSSSCIALMHYLWSALLSLEKEIKGFCRSIFMFETCVCIPHSCGIPVQVDIRPEWTVLEQIPLSSLSKLSFEVGEPEDM